jgi:hypothetical protein
MSSALRVRRGLNLLTSLRWRVCLAALLPVSALLAGVLTTSPASASSQGLLSSYTGAFGEGCLDAWQDTHKLLNLVVAYPCSNDDPAEYWYYDGTYIHPAGGNGPDYGSCLDVYGNGGVGSPVDLYYCNGTDAQKWTLNGNGQLVNKSSCLDIPKWGYGMTQPGGNPIQMHVWSCGNIGPWQQWFFTG